MIDRPLLLCLVALCGVAIALRDKRMAGAAGILLANWLACTAYIAATKPEVPTWASVYPWPIFGAFDYAAGFSILVLLRQYGRVTVWQCLVGLIYAAELVVHGAVGVEVIANTAPEWALYQGFQYLEPAAWAQVLVMGVWSGVELARRYGMPIRRVSARNAPMGRRGELAKDGANEGREVTR